MNKQHDISVIRRVFLISTIILVMGLGGAFFLSQWLSKFFPNYYAGIQTVLMLFMIWLVVTSTLRSLQQLIFHISGIILLSIGTMVTGVGLLLYWIFLSIYSAVSIDYEVNFSWTPIWVFTALGLVVSIMTLINLRIENEKVRRILEVLLVLVVLVIILFLTT